MKYIFTMVIFIFSCVALYAQPSQTIQTANIIEILIQHRVVEYAIFERIKDKSTLRILRNAVYASHGYDFKTKELKEYFSQFSWYTPSSSNVDALLTPADKQNIESIQYCELFVLRDELMQQKNPRFSQSLTTQEQLLVGIWQVGPHMASGWNTTYTFFENRIVLFRSNQMDGEQRLIGKIGWWKKENDHIIMEFFSQELLVGGTLVEAWGSYASDRVLEGASPKHAAITPHEVVRWTLSTIEKDPETDRSEYLTMRLNEKQFWRLRNDPYDY